MLAFVDSLDGYYEFAENAPPEWYAHLTPTERRSASVPLPSPAAEIDRLERETLLPRPVRDVLLALMVREAEALGLTEPQLYATNIGYRRVRDLDNQIAALRAQL